MAARPAQPHPRFTARSRFYAELKRRVDGYFESTGRPRRDVPRMYLKTALILVWAVASWVTLVFVVDSPWTAAPAALSLSFALAGVGMGIMHDANHGAYSRRDRVNAVFGFLLDLLGASSLLWKQKHNVVHHTYTNIQGWDDDLDGKGLLRLSPHEPWRWYHRFQHVYAWPVYGLLVFGKIFGDFVHVANGRYGAARVRRPDVRQMAVLIAGKLSWAAWALVIPVLFHPLPIVVGTVLFVTFVEGLILGVTFQLAHCSTDAAFVEPPDDLALGRDWAVHQVETTVDFARSSRLATWYLGGLNFQIEHHLFPRICHLHYPALARIVEETAAKYGVRYRAHPSFGTALVAHYRWIRALGRRAHQAREEFVAGHGSLRR